MRRLTLWIVCSAMAVSLPAAAPNAGAETSVSINMRVGDPYRGPSLEFRHEPDVVLVPDTRVYYVRDYDYDIYRYGSYWYFTYDGGWYRARRYNGRYVYIGYESVPRAVVMVPVKYRKHWREPRGNAYGHYKDARNDKGHGRGRGHGHGHGN